MAGKTVELEIKGKAAWIFLNRAEKYNAINKEMVEELDELLTRLESEKGVVAIVITSKAKVFSAGLDLKELSSIGGIEDSQEIFYNRLYKLIKKMATLKKPVIVVVNGAAIGGAFELLYGADIVIATEKAKFSIAEARWGFVPPFSVVIGSLLMGLQNASRLILTTEEITADEAYRLGIVSKVVKEDSIEDAVEYYVSMLSKSSPESVYEMKRIMAKLKFNPMVEWAFESLVKTGAKKRNIENIVRFMSEKKLPSWEW